MLDGVANRDEETRGEMAGEPVCAFHTMHRTDDETPFAGGGSPARASGAIPDSAARGNPPAAGRRVAPCAADLMRR